MEQQGVDPLGGVGAASPAMSPQEEHEAWQRRGAAEDVLEPDMPIVDAHHHLWYRRTDKLEMADYMLEELCRDINESGHNIVATVYMQSTSMGWGRAEGPEELRPVGETELMQGIAVQGESGLYTKARVCAGIIGTANLLLGEAVEPVLRAHCAVARNFRGVRFLGGRAEQIPYADPRLRAALVRVQSLGLVFECSGPEKHPLDFDGVLGGIADLADAFPDLTIVVDHCGGAVGPRSFDGQPEKRAEWERCVRRLASCPNTHMKIGGFQMPVNGFCLGSADRPEPAGSTELAELTLPYCSVIIREFGARRCMFESNYPPDRSGSTYRNLWNSFKRIAQMSRLSPDEKAAIFHGTAARVYRLSAPGLTSTLAS